MQSFDAANTFAPVGSIVFSHREQRYYTVLSHNDDGSVTVMMLAGRSGDGRESRTITHRSPMDPLDEIVGIRERLTHHSRDHRVALARRLAATSTMSSV